MVSAATILEGGILGLFQWRVLRLPLPELSWRTWVIATAAGALVGAIDARLVFSPGGRQPVIDRPFPFVDPPAKDLFVEFDSPLPVVYSTP